MWGGGEGGHACNKFALQQLHVMNHVSKARSSNMDDAAQGTSLKSSESQNVNNAGLLQCDAVVWARGQQAWTSCNVYCTSRCIEAKHLLSPNL